MRLIQRKSLNGAYAVLGVALSLGLPEQASPQTAPLHTAPPEAAPLAARATRATTAILIGSGKKVKVEYGQLPRPQGKVFGGAVPFDRIWATGTGAATSISTEAELKFDEGSIQRGHFSLHLLPSEKQWLLVVNQQTGQDAAGYDPNFEFARFKINHRVLPPNIKPANHLTIILKKLDRKHGRLTFAMDRTEAWVDFVEGNSKAHIHGEKEDDDD